MGIADYLKEKNRREVKLEDGGLLVAYHLPDIQACLLAGDVPLPILRELTQNDGEKATTEDIDTAAKQMYSAKLRIVATMIEAVDGQEIGPDEDRIEIASSFSPDQREELYEIGARARDPNSGEA